MTQQGGHARGGGHVLDDMLHAVLQALGEVAAATWKVWVPGGVAVALWWGWTREAWIGADGWDTVRLGLWLLAALLAVVAPLWVRRRVRTWPRRRAGQRAADALDSQRVRGRAIITAADGVGGYIQLEDDEHLSDLKRKRVEGALSAKLGAAVELGVQDRKDRIPIRRVRTADEVDRLAEVIPAIPYPAGVDLGLLKRLHVGTCADGKPFLLNIVEGNHTFIAGATKAGKGSVEQSILRQCAPLVHAGLLRVIFVDPKGGIEAIPVRFMCERVIVCRGNNINEVVEHFQALVGEMEASAARVMSQGRRDHVPTREHPATLVIIDEVASLTKYLGAPKTQREIESCIGAMTTQGRAAGWSVIAAVQDPRKEVISIRSLFPQRIALRLSEPHEVDWVLGSAVRERGADCHLIPTSLPGVGFVAQDGSNDSVRVRFAYPTDDDLADMCRRFRAPGEPVVWGLPPGVKLPPGPASLTKS